MSQGESKKDVPGRKFDQPVSGSNTAGSMGSGGTGDRGSAQGAAGGAEQSAGRTDDLLSGGTDAEQQSEGFAGGQGGPGGMQSADPNQPGTKRPTNK